MSKTLYVQYLEAQAEWKEKKSAELMASSDKAKLDYLENVIWKEDLQLEQRGNHFVICTNDGQDVTDEFESLDEVEAWLNDPVFVFSDDD